jgi:hypothetical protein
MDSPVCSIEFHTDATQALVIWRWHNECGPLSRLKKVINKLREILREAERDYELSHNNRNPNALAHFDMWVDNYLGLMRQRIEEWGERWTSELLSTTYIKNNAADRAICGSLQTAFKTLDDIDTTGFFPVLP